VDNGCFGIAGIPICMDAARPYLRRIKAEREKWYCHKRAEGSPECAQLHTRSTEASGFDSNARLGRTGHKERTPWLVEKSNRKNNDD
jgi:hypothetical protein